MKKLFAFTILCLMTAAAYSQSNEKIHWMTLQEAEEKNAIAPRKIFIDVYTSWCGWCKRMDATTFTDSAVVKYMNENFYAVKLDAETKETITFRNKQYKFFPKYKANEIAAYFLNGQMSYPTTVYLNEKLDLIAPVQGYLTTEQFLPVLKYFGENIYLTKTWEDWLSENFR